MCPPIAGNETGFSQFFGWALVLLLGKARWHRAQNANSHPTLGLLCSSIIRDVKDKLNSASSRSVASRVGEEKKSAQLLPTSTAEFFFAYMKQSPKIALKIVFFFPMTNVLRCLAIFGPFSITLLYSMYKLHARIVFTNRSCLHFKIVLLILDTDY